VCNVLHLAGIKVVEQFLGLCRVVAVPGKVCNSLLLPGDVQLAFGHVSLGLRQMVELQDRSGIRDSGFGREVNKAISRRARRLVEMGLATAKDGNVRVPVDTVATLERQEVDRVGQQLARDRGVAAWLASLASSADDSR